MGNTKGQDSFRAGLYGNPFISFDAGGGKA